jgi:hypothetical protein
MVNRIPFSLEFCKALVIVASGEVCFAGFLVNVILLEYIADTRNNCAYKIIWSHDVISPGYAVIDNLGLSVETQIIMAFVFVDIRGFKGTGSIKPFE